MPKFNYVACEASGQEVTGTLEAPSRGGVLNLLANQHLFPVSVVPVESATEQSRWARRRVSSKHLTMFYRQLADLLRSGVPLLRSLELLERLTSSATLNRVVLQVREEVAEGTRLAEALGQHPYVFSHLAVNMVRAGEEGSFLEDVLKRISIFTEHQQDLKNRVYGAMIYPIFLMTMISLIVVGMLVFFVPNFQPLLDRLSEQGELPWPTITLLGFSDFTHNYWPLALVALVVTGLSLSKWIQSESGRSQIDALMIRGFGIGPVVRSLAIARFCRILGTLLGNGVPILRSLSIAKEATANSVLSSAIGAAAENISEGKSLAGPLGASRQFPEEIVEMIAVGEEANNLEQVLIDIADSMERRTKQLLDIFVRMLEPILLTGIAGVVLFVVAALLLPIMQTASIF
ncbi:MAG: type II secretion system F family protein [Pirellulales bacterium]